MNSYTSKMDSGYNESSHYITNITLTSDIIGLSPVTSEYILWYFRLIVFGILGQFMAIFGVITNTINIIIFLKLGVRKDSMNVSLLGLSISDFCSCFSVVFLNLCLTPGFMESEDFPFVPITTHYLYSSYPHIIFVKITCCITAFITLERCLCVIIPLKVRNLFTPKRVALITVFMYVLIFSLTAPVYHFMRMAWVFFEERNRTLYTLVFHEDRDKMEPTVVMIFGVIVPFITFFATIISTAVLVQSLKKNAMWRNSVTTVTTNNSDSNDNSSSKKSQLSTRDARVAKMVASISALFIGSNGPITIHALAVLFVPELKVGGAYQNTLYVIFSLNCLFESTNASLNIFIYYTMSTNYKTMLQSIFSKNAKK